ncbi:MAG TPA: alpha/beta fold hydrolase [Solirubrobacterales bacterium]|jgi:pimeloyl-ACP methyl ester carboxylesterase/predicted glycosyltransferase|nr:alpha/beta fold hydrolase [Solirubrobacterales bacterium]
MAIQTTTGSPPQDTEAPRGAPEQSRARYPGSEGFVERAGQRIFWELYGEGEETIFLLPTWSMLHSRHWKMQIPYLARHFRVLTMDGLGNGRSDRPRDPRRYRAVEFARDCLAVMAATGTEQAVTVSLSAGARYQLELARLAPERMLGAVFTDPMFPYTPSHLWLMRSKLVWWAIVRPAISPHLYRWWARFNAVHWRREYPVFVEWFVSRALPEPHSTKAIEDGVGWALETDGKTLAATVLDEQSAHRTNAPRELRGLAQSLDCPVLVVSGDRDMITPPRDARALARLSAGKFETVKGAGHLQHARKPVGFNLMLREFAEDAFKRPRTPRDPTVFRPDGRPRALFVSSPIGLGHARRDVAIARELRALHPDLQVDWLAQDPVTRVLEAEGERIHPASAHLANESTHIESESAEHDLHAFHAIRRMDEILAANFMAFHDIVREERYDLWIGDEAWELDYYLHENPREKRVPYVWLSDFVGFLPMDERNERESFLTADFNAQRIDHIAEHPDVRDLSLFVGNPDDIIPKRFGPGLPMIRDWAERNYQFTGYISGFDRADLGDRAKLRAELGYDDDEQVCIVTVGGSGVGADLLRRVMAAFPQAKERIPKLRMIVVAGPRINPESLGGWAPINGLEVVPYVHNLYRHLAACDLAVVQGGLTTSMELTANKRPFLYFPLRHHFEQNFHVRHRLERYGAGRRMDYDDSPPEQIAAAIAQEIGRDVDYHDVETDGARLAAQHIAELLN